MSLQDVNRKLQREASQRERGPGIRKHWKRCREHMGWHLPCWQRTEVKTSSSRYWGRDLGYRTTVNPWDPYPPTDPTSRQEARAFWESSENSVPSSCVQPFKTLQPQLPCPVFSSTFALHITLRGPKQTTSTPAHSLPSPMPTSFRAQPHSPPAWFHPQQVWLTTCDLSDLQFPSLPTNTSSVSPAWLQSSCAPSAF